MPTTQRDRAWLVMLAAVWAAIVFPVSAHAERGLNLVVIAHSFSTRTEAREVLRRQGWTETTNLSQADGILVVCRSTLRRPLDSSYGSIGALDGDVDSQLNLSGSRFHVYLYHINDNLSVDEVQHIDYPVND